MEVNTKSSWGSVFEGIRRSDGILIATRDNYYENMIITEHANNNLLFHHNKPCSGPQLLLIKNNNNNNNNANNNNNRRTTLSELFMKTKNEIIDDDELSNSVSKIAAAAGGSKHKTDDKSSVHIKLMAKILKTRKSSSSVTTNVEYSADEDHQLTNHKILPMIQYYLEALAVSENMRKNVQKSQQVTKENIHKDHEEDIIISPKPTNCSNSVSHAKRERWIKSDAEYLILEL
ncbi:hypothetical protein E3N88_03697 [Mikania micrantha]|uniref:Uncharacterized protein n=1 Tax=Mikania micrantha TaxID=192012 RepID=A0A5N6PSA2_9ASTR|nr:hypothetical protein E3N88_03697 [Mikania micrantha]